ncbi:MAG: cation:proton antiporter, partial [Phycisphaerae bacterium]|nr:cation:proton antiporter [Phycisphaerae bacterium]
MKKQTILYLGLLLLFFAAVWALIAVGGRMYAGTAAAPTVRAGDTHPVNPLLTLVIQIVLIILLGRALGAVCRLIGQPQVIGEMAAGIILGPSLFGWVAPEAWSWVFPDASRQYLHVLSQVGVILFLFLIGLELDPKLLSSRGMTALFISHSSMIVPFVMGVALMLYLYPRFFRDVPGMEFTAVALFMGAAMSVTAFPVLARILTERNLHKTELGKTAITCAAIDDATAWCILAVVVGLARADGLMPGLITAGAATAYALGMIFLVRPLLRRLQRIYEHAGRLSPGIVGLILILVLASAWLTELIGIHALFGAFMMGAMMPNGTAFVRNLSEKFEDFTVAFLLPIFFAYVGLQTQFGLILEGGYWLDTLLIILIASASKFIGSSGAARLTGMGGRDAAALGVLMNARGLMELVILQIGLQEGVLTPPVFAMMVIMALVTTAMTAPLLSWILPAPRVLGRRVASGGFDVLVPVAAPESGPAMARLAAAIIGNGQPAPGRLLALHLVQPQEEQFGGGLSELDFQRDEALSPILNESRQLRLGAEAISFPSRDVPGDIAAVARARGASLVLMGFHKPVFGTEILGGTVHHVLQQTTGNVA